MSIIAGQNNVLFFHPESTLVAVAWHMSDIRDVYDLRNLESFWGLVDAGHDQIG
jgi:hypothetical protein